MTGRRDAATVLAMVAWVRKRLKAIEEAARDAADVTYPQEKTAGTVGGTVVSYTQRVLRKPQQPFSYLSEAQFVEWVKRRWPSEIQESVRPTFLAYLAERAEQHGGVLIDDEGEVCEWVKSNDPTVYTMTTLTKDADAVLAPLLSMQTLDDLPRYIEQGEPQDLDEEQP